MVKLGRDFSKNDDAVVEILSEILLTAIIVIAIGAVAVFLLASLDGQDSARVDIKSISDTESNNLYFKHTGGEAIDIDKLEFMVSVNDTDYTLTPQNYSSDEWYLGDTIEISVPENVTTDTRLTSKIVHTGASLVIYDAKIYGTSGSYIPDTEDGNGGNGETNIIDEGYGRITLNNDGSNGYIADDSLFEFKILTGSQNIDIDNVRHTFSNKDVVRFVVSGDQEEGSIYISEPQIQTFDLEIDLFVNDVKEDSGTITDISLWKVEYLDVDITYIVPSNGEWTDLKNNSISIDGYPSESLEDNISIYITDISEPNSFLLNMNITNNWIDVNPASYKITSNN